MKKYAYGAALLVSGILALPQTQNALRVQAAMYTQRQEAREILATISREEAERASPSYKQEVDNLTTGLDKNFSLLVSASWCAPCKSLEAEMRRRGQGTEHHIMAETASESAYLRKSLAERSIPSIDNVPALIVSRKGVVAVYRGYDKNSHAMFTQYGMNMPLEEILKK